MVFQINLNVISTNVGVLFMVAGLVVAFVDFEIKLKLSFLSVVVVVLLLSLLP
jgi:hypothetical protein